MKCGHHKFLKASEGRCNFAEVAVECDCSSDGLVIQISPSAIEGYDGWRAAAQRGVLYAIHNSEPQLPIELLSVTVVRIVGTDVDTTDAAVATAACHATWKALGVSGTHPPRFEDGKIVFDP